LICKEDVYFEHNVNNYRRMLMLKSSGAFGECRDIVGPQENYKIDNYWGLYSNKELPLYSDYKGGLGWMNFPEESLQTTASALRISPGVWRVARNLDLSGKQVFQ
jgi:hypothetical protein